MKEQQLEEQTLGRGGGGGGGGREDTITPKNKIWGNICTLLSVFNFLGAVLGHGGCGYVMVGSLTFYHFFVVKLLAMKVKLEVVIDQNQC